MMSLQATSLLFLDLCRVATGRDTALSAAPRAGEWRDLYAEARRQTLAGVLFPAVERLPESQRPPRSVLLPWYAETVRLEALNRQADLAAVTVTRRLAELGLRGVLLKGQGVARLYPRPALRAPGDVDIWVEGPRLETLGRLARVGKVGHVTYHHADWLSSGGAEAEVHSRPTWMYSPRLNARLRRWLAAEAPRQFGGESLRLVDAGGTVGEVTVPTAAFNLVFLLVHLFRHTLTEGVGLRQLMDYYYALMLPLSATGRAGALAVIERLGLAVFAGAVMHVEERVFGLPREAMLTAPRPREGELLLADVMRGGNFGRYHGGTHGPAGRLVRVWRLARLCPEEALFALPFKVWHAGWRLAAAWRLARGPKPPAPPEAAA